MDTNMDIKSIKQENIEPEKEGDPKFKLICLYKDTNSTNLSKVFESYGCSTLEAKVPIINHDTVERLNEVDSEQKLYATLAFKSKSANDALDGRHPRTRNRELRMVEVDNELVLAAGKVREESPVDEEALDEEMEQYIKERDRLIALKKAGIQPTATNLNAGTGGVNVPSNRVEPPKVKTEKPVKSGGDNDTVQAMDEDLEAYMREAARKRHQKRNLAENTDRTVVMDFLEQDFDLDNH